MSYSIILTNGSTLTQVNDGTLDQTSTDLTLIGQNTSGYGLFVNDNFVHLLENFANVTQPSFPILGQLWFDTSENRLKVYDGTSFKVSGGTIVANSAPSSITKGDIWLDSLRQQMYFNDGNSTKLAGPLFTAAQGQSGFIVSDVLDTNNLNHTVVFLYVAQTLLGIFSKDSFTPSAAISGYTGNITVGFNVANYTGITFNVPTTRANTLVASDGTLKTPADFLSTTTNASTVGTLSIQNSVPLILGTSSNTEIDVSATLFNIRSNSLNQNFQISSLSNSGLTSSLFINSTTKRVGIYTATPQAMLDVAGDVIIEGNLTVQGSTTTVNSTTINIVDKLLVLGSTASPSDSTASGGGLELAGTTTKSILYNNSIPSWDSSETINIASGKTYKINGFDVITSNSLGSVITSAPGLNSIGTLTTLGVGYISVANSTISYSNLLQANGTIYLVPKGTGTVDVASAKITNVATPASTTDAANKTYVDTAITLAPLGIGLVTTGLTNAQIASNFLSKIFPASEHPETTICRVACSDNSVRLFQMTSSVWTYQTTL
jgi:hypothetical protein